MLKKIIFVAVLSLSSLKLVALEPSSEAPETNEVQEVSRPKYPKWLQRRIDAYNFMFLDEMGCIGVVIAALMPDPDKCHKSKSRST